MGKPLPWYVLINHHADSDYEKCHRCSSKFLLEDYGVRYQCTNASCTGFIIATPVREDLAFYRRSPFLAATESLADSEDDEEEEGAPSQ